LETKWLEDFLALAETGNFTRAAQARNASQAAFSRRIQALEMAVNANLVDRSIYPTKLTPAGEAFRARAAEILARLREAVQDISAGGPGGALRIALPSALGATFAGRWLKLWAPEKLRYSIEPGGVHDMFTALASGRADLLITYYSPLQPIQIDPQRFERLLVGQSHVRPYAHRDVRDALRFPGTPKRPVRLLDFPPTVYFGRLIETIIERAPQKLHADRIVECEMADVLRDAALSGLGIVWLPACVVDPIAHAGLEPVDDGSWTLDVEIMAFRDRESSNPALCRLWERLKAAPTLVPSPH
jgi:DNA-binding transcriptional LysR family regulator